MLKNTLSSFPYFLENCGFYEYLMYTRDKNVKRCISLVKSIFATRAHLCDYNRANGVSVGARFFAISLFNYGWLEVLSGTSSGMPVSNCTRDLAEIRQAHSRSVEQASLRSTVATIAISHALPRDINKASINSRCRREMYRLSH